MNAEAEPPPRPTQTRTVVRWVLPSLAFLCVAGLGQLSQGFGFLALFQNCALMVWLVVLLFKLGQGVVRKLGTAPLLLVAMVLSYGALRVGVADVYGVPLWVKREVVPAQERLEQRRKVDGRYPEQAEGLPHGCVYTLKEDGYRLTCEGVFMNRCTYESKDDHWFSWD